MNISAELSLPPDERQDPVLLMNTIRGEIERLSEIAPPIPARVIAAFKAKYPHEENVARPQITNGLECIEIYKPEVKPELKPEPKEEVPVVREHKKSVFKP